MNLTLKELHYVWLFLAFVFVTIHLNSRRPGLTFVFFSISALVAVWVATGGTTLGTETRASIDASRALADAYNNQLKPFLPEVLFDDPIWVDRPETLQYCLVDPSVVRALRKLLYLKEFDLDAVSKSVAFTEVFYKYYASELSRKDHATSQNQRAIDDMLETRKLLLNYLYSLHVSRGPTTYPDNRLSKIITVLTARTYKCLNTLSNKHRIHYKNPIPFQQAPPRSFQLIA